MDKSWELILFGPHVDYTVINRSVYTTVHVNLKSSKCFITGNKADAFSRSQPSVPDLYHLCLHSLPPNAFAMSKMFQKRRRLGIHPRSQ